MIQPEFVVADAGSMSPLGLYPIKYGPRAAGQRSVSLSLPSLSAVENLDINHFQHQQNLNEQLRTATEESQRKKNEEQEVLKRCRR